MQYQSPIPRDIKVQFNFALRTISKGFFASWAADSSQIFRRGFCAKKNEDEEVKTFLGILKNFSSDRSVKIECQS